MVTAQLALLVKGTRSGVCSIDTHSERHAGCPFCNTVNQDRAYSVDFHAHGHPAQFRSILCTRLLPLAPAVLISRASLMPVRKHATKNTPGGDDVADRLIDAIHIAKDEMHEPREDGVACKSRRRPIARRLTNGKDTGRDKG